MENTVWWEDRTGLTALHYAVESENADVVGKLLTHWKTDVFRQASNGHSPWSIAFPITSRWQNPHHASSLTQTQRSLKGNAETQFSEWVLTPKEVGKRSYNLMHQPKRTVNLMQQQKLIKQAIALAARAENELDLWDDLHSLENQILHSFETSLGQEYPGLSNRVSKSQEFVMDHPWKLNLLHAASFYNFGQELEELVKLKEYKKLVNEREGKTYFHYSPLDLALNHGGAHSVAALLKVDNLLLTDSTSDDVTTYIDVLKTKFAGDMDSLCLDQGLWATLVENTKKLTDESDLYRNRQVYVDAANAILVGAALIASVTFAGFLQPPLGYVQYDTNENFPSPAPPSPPESFAAVGQHNSVRIFWVFNSLSFFFSIATVITGAGAVLPSSGYSIGKEVQLVKKWLRVTAALLAASIFCVLGAFTAAGSASLPTIAKYQFTFVSTAAIGLAVSLVSLCAFCYRLVLSLKPMKPFYVIGLLVMLEAGVILYFAFKPVLHRITRGILSNDDQYISR